MAIPRSKIVDPDQPGVYHCISRCVRRAHLCGGAFEHRRWWIRKRLRTLTRIFAIDTLSYAVMDNHLHSVLWTDPQRVRTWSDQEVADRWLRLFPPPQGIKVSERRAQLLANPHLLTVLRHRLCDLGWFHKALKEPLARIANQEDGVTGAFWEGRFKSIRVLDDPGILTTCIYSDLNLIRAGLAETPETSTLTSVWERIQWRAVVKRIQRLRHHARRSSIAALDEPNAAVLAGAPDARWLVPLDPPPAGTSNKRRTILGIGVDAYIALVDQVGRLVRPDKRGVIPAELPPILERLGMELSTLLDAVNNPRLWGTAIGSPASLAAEAARRGTTRVIYALRTR